MRATAWVGVAAGTAGLTALVASCGPTSSPSAPASPPPGPAGPTYTAPAAPTTPTDSIYFGQREAPEKMPGTIRLATYNLLNLFDNVDDPTLSGDAEDIDDAKPDDQKQALARAIRRLNADVLALQEIESESALREFRDQYLATLGYVYLVSIDTGDPRGIECAVLSRFPLTNVQTWAGLELGGIHPDTWGSQPNEWAGQPITFKRSPLRVDVEVPRMSDGDGNGQPGYTMTLFVVHNKSGGPGGYWREAESRKIVELVAQARTENAEANIIVLGDMNAMSQDQSVRTVLDAGFTEILPFDPERALATTSHESNRRIDHILVSGPALREVVQGSAFILGTPSREPGADWRTTAAPAGLASDHFPVAVDLWIGDR